MNNKENNKLHRGITIFFLVIVTIFLPIAGIITIPCIIITLLNGLFAMTKRGVAKGAVPTSELSTWDKVKRILLRVLVVVVGAWAVALYVLIQTSL